MIFRYLVSLLAIFFLSGCGIENPVEFSNLLTKGAAVTDDGEVFEGKPEGTYYNYANGYSCVDSHGATISSYKSSISYEEPGYEGKPVSLGDKCDDTFLPLDPDFVNTSFLSAGFIIYDSAVYHSGMLRFESSFDPIVATANVGESINIMGTFLNVGGPVDRYNLVLYVRTPISAMSLNQNKTDLFAYGETRNQSFNFTFDSSLGPGVYEFRVCVIVPGSNHDFYDFCSLTQRVDVQ